MVDQGFLKEANREMILISSDIDDLLNQMRDRSSASNTLRGFPDNSFCRDLRNSQG
jgi:hypothetical protein